MKKSRSGRGGSAKVLGRSGRGGSAKVLTGLLSHCETEQGNISLDTFIVTILV